MIEIRTAAVPDDLPVVRELFREYVDGLCVDLSFQDIEAELAGLPGRYALPAGRLLLAWRDGEAIGCVALRALDGGDCEMKRLYVRPHARGARLGRALAERLCGEALAAGYARICLDTLPTMGTAQAMYAELGFVPIAPYVFNPIPGTRYLALDLRRGA